MKTFPRESALSGPTSQLPASTRSVGAPSARASTIAAERRSSPPNPCNVGQFAHALECPSVSAVSNRVGCVGSAGDAIAEEPNGIAAITIGRIAKPAIAMLLQPERMSDMMDIGTTHEMDQGKPKGKPAPPPPARPLP